MGSNSMYFEAEAKICARNFFSSCITWHLKISIGNWGYLQKVTDFTYTTLAFICNVS